jgi:hypothetical protein
LVVLVAVLVRLDPDMIRPHLSCGKGTPSSAFENSRFRRPTAGVVSSLQDRLCMDIGLESTEEVALSTM